MIPADDFLFSDNAELVLIDALSLILKNISVKVLGSVEIMNKIKKPKNITARVVSDCWVEVYCHNQLHGDSGGYFAFKN